MPIGRGGTVDSMRIRGSRFFLAPFAPSPGPQQRPPPQPRPRALTAGGGAGAAELIAGPAQRSASSNAEDVIRGDVNVPPGQRYYFMSPHSPPAVANPKTRLWCPHTRAVSLLPARRPALSRNHDHGREFDLWVVASATLAAACAAAGQSPPRTPSRRPLLKSNLFDAPSNRHRRWA